MTFLVVLNVACCDCPYESHKDYCGEVIDKQEKRRVVCIPVNHIMTTRVQHKYLIKTEWNEYDVSKNQYDDIKIGDEYYVDHTYKNHKKSCRFYKNY